MIDEGVADNSAAPSNDIEHARRQTRLECQITDARADSDVNSVGFITIV